MPFLSRKIFMLLAMFFSTCFGYAQDSMLCDAASVKAAPHRLTSTPANRFLDTLGVNLHIDQGYDATSYIAPLKYLGVRQIRDGGRHVGSLVSVARNTGVRVSLISEGDLDADLSAARVLAQTGALLALEGPNEPNNFAITYNGQKGGQSFGWTTVADYQRDLYARVKADPILSGYPVFQPSEVGAESENVGLQFLTIPKGAQTLFPDGTRYADFANVHNYVSAVNGGYHDNQAWNASDPILRGRWDGLAGNNGITWYKKFQGYSESELRELPRVTTETGYDAGESLEEQRRQGIVLINTYLAQYSRNWAYTFIYEMRDNEGGESLQGLYSGNRPKLAAEYIHNMTAILADVPGKYPSVDTDVTLATSAPTVHAFLLFKTDGKGVVVIWGERASGTDIAVIDFARATELKVYDVTHKLGWTESLSDTKTLCLNITDHALFVEY